MASEIAIIKVPALSLGWRSSLRWKVA